MASDQVEQLVSDISGIADVDPSLARMWVRDSGRRTLEVRHWSFLRRRAQIVIPTAISNLTTSATVNIASGGTTATFSSALCTPSMVGQQIRFSSASNVVGAVGPIFDIVGFNSSSSLEVYPPWGLASLSASPFTIFTAYVTMPTDFAFFVSVVDTVYRRRLRTNVQREHIDRYDAARNRLGGPPSLLCPLDYSPVYIGSINSALHIVGTGATPTSGGTYRGVSDAIFTVQINGSGIGGVATYIWRKNDLPFSGTLVSSTIGSSLSDGVTVLFDAAATYASGDVFVIRTASMSTAGAPRMELYPYQSSAYVFPYVYSFRYPDITESNVVLPGIIARRDDVIREKALEMAATYPGTADRPNNYNQINRRDYHAANWRQLVDELSREDNETMQTDVKSDPSLLLPYAALPWTSGSDMQSFDPPWLYDGAMGYY